MSINWRRQQAGIPPCPPDLAARTLAEIDRMEKETYDWIAASRPQPYTWDGFHRAWDEACRKAYDADPFAAELTVSLPHECFPNVTQVANTYTGTWVTIRRYSWSPFGKLSPTRCTSAHFPGGLATSGVNRNGMGCVLPADHEGPHQFDRPVTMSNWTRP